MLTSATLVSLPINSAQFPFCAKITGMSTHTKVLSR